jgi:UDP-GlcNAc:undecaprenyl-phosphate GlcNAc-1-phosphate transferase
MTGSERIVLEAGAGLAATFLATVLAVPVVLKFAPVEGLTDRFDDARTGEPRRIPRLGGVAMMIATAITLLFVEITTGFHPGGREALGTLGPALGIAAAIVFVVGLVDDLRGVRPIVKIVAQSVAALILIRVGVRVDAIAVPWGAPVVLGWLAVPVTLLWIVGVSNAINLVDGLDGLASSVAFATLAGVFGAALVLHHTTIGIVAASLAGATLGFLVYNRAPARIFLGDSGSLMIGLLLAVLTIEAARDASGAVLVMVPLLSLAYPLLDTGVSMLRRWLRGDPLSRADGRHIHHQLCAVGFSPPETVGAIAIAALCGSALGLAAAFERPVLTAIVAGVSLLMLVLVFVYGVRWLEYDEFLEAGASVARLARQGRQALRLKIRARELGRAITESPTLELVEQVLSDARAELGLVAIHLARESARRDLTFVSEDVPPLGVWKLDRPVAVTRTSSPVDPIVLRLWSDSVEPSGTLHAARIAAIVAPALRDWFAVHGVESARLRYPEVRGRTPPHGFARLIEASES